MSKEKTGEMKACKNCKKEFYVIRSKKERTKFCSSSCRHNTPPDDFKRVCKKCKGCFEVTSETKKQVYCSLSCFYDRTDLVDKIYYVVYKTTNIINNKEYIGIHKTSQLDDGYIGNGIYRQKDAIRIIEKENSSRPFVKAVVKYGYESFKRDIIRFCESYDELLIEEEKLVTLEYIKRKETYNVQLGGRNGGNLSNLKPYDLTDNNGFRYVGENIKDFCILNNLSYVAILSLIRGELKTSQGLQRTVDYKKPQVYVIVNMETNEVFKTTNLFNWCKENAKELIQQKQTKLHCLVAHRRNTALKKWWACKEEEWKGYAGIAKTVYKYDNKYKVIDGNGTIHTVGDLREFCRINSMSSTKFREMIRGNRKSCKNFKLYTE